MEDDPSRSSKDIQVAIISMFLLQRRSSRETISNQSLMPHNSSPFTYPSLSLSFSPKRLYDSDFLMSPTSPLETKRFSNTDKNQKNAPIGLALVDFLHNEPKSDTNSFFLVSQLKIQVPRGQSNSLPSPKSPIELGVKNKDHQLSLHSPSGLGSPRRPPFSPEFLTDMELSEEYTCVISHGPNPKTTHIFDNCIVENCDGNGFVALRKENKTNRSADDFLRFCDACKRNLCQGRDIFMYRGEKAFCSKECRCRVMLLEEEREKFSQDLVDLL